MFTCEGKEFPHPPDLGECPDCVRRQRNNYRDHLRVYLKENDDLRALLRRVLCHPLGAELEADIITALRIQPKG